MVEEKIIELAKQERQKYCDIYNEGINHTTHHCEDEGCPLYRHEYRCGSAEFYVGFFDGFKAGYKIGFDEGHDEGFTEARLGEDW